MIKLLKNILVALAASIGFVAIVLSVLYMLGYDVPVISDCECLRGCCKQPQKKNGKASAPAPTKVKRHYTKLVLPED